MGPTCIYFWEIIISINCSVVQEPSGGGCLHRGIGCFRASASVAGALLDGGWAEVERQGGAPLAVGGGGRRLACTVLAAGDVQSWAVRFFYLHSLPLLLSPLPSLYGERSSHFINHSAIKGAQLLPAITSFITPRYFGLFGLSNCL